MLQTVVLFTKLVTNLYHSAALAIYYSLMWNPGAVVTTGQPPTPLPSGGSGLNSMTPSGGVASSNDTATLQQAGELGSTERSGFNTASMPFNTST